MIIRILLATLALALVSVSAFARELKVGLAAAVTSMDPHFHNLSPNNSLLRHVFEPLVKQDPNQKLTPGLAKSWRAVDDLTWEFALRRNVRWHDGTPFTADDVAFTLKRAPNVPNSPSSFAHFIKPISEVKVVDSHTLVLRTMTPHPLMPYDMAAVLIVSRKHGETAATEDYNSGKAMVGTGPYRFHSYTPNQQVTLKANFAYWGGEEPWETLTFKLLSNPAARVAALLSGDVQAIESVPSTDISTLGKSAQVELFSKISNRLIYLAPEQERDQAPFVTGKDGKPLAGNPLKDVRVRRAVSLALDRPAIAARVMEGKALPASQILPDGFPGVSRRLRPDKHDAAAARQLLAEAGYPNGFSLTLFATNNRYINDARIAQTIAQMLSRIGIDSKVEALPASVFFTRASKREFGIFMAGWGAETGEAASPLKALLATHNPAAGKGASNRMRYSNASFDATLTEALATIDPLKRESILARANEIAFSELGIIPVHHEISTWAVKRGIVMKPRVDQYTLAMDMRPR